VSRIGKQPVVIPSGVEIKIEGTTVIAKGPKGELSQKLPPLTSSRVEESLIRVEAKNASKEARAMHGLARSLVANLVEGVEKGFSKTLELSGIGFRASVTSGKLTLNVGFSHPVEITPPEGIEFKVQENKITVLGIDKQLVGQMAAKVYKVRPPEPYKGKGIKFAGQIIKKKAGKSGKAGAKV